MRIVIQRTKTASVEVGGKMLSAIGQGLLILLGIEHDDDKTDADRLVKKSLAMRIFDDQEGVMNLSVLDTDNEIMVISQFTLHASTKKGNRPSYIRAARPEQAIPLYEYFCDQLEAGLGKAIGKGEFGGDMKVSLINDGPVTIIMDSKDPSF